MKKRQSAGDRDAQDRGSYQRREKSESTFPWLSLLCSTRSSINHTTWGSEALIQHMINNWCASKHWRYMHTWSEWINSSCGWSTLSGGFHHHHHHLVCRQLAYVLLYSLQQLLTNRKLLVSQPGHRTCPTITQKTQKLNRQPRYRYLLHLWSFSSKYSKIHKHCAQTHRKLFYFSYSSDKAVEWGKCVIK